MVLALLSSVLIALIIIDYFGIGSPLFCQERVVNGKKSFRLMKFPSMHVNAPLVTVRLASAS